MHVYDKETMCVTVTHVSIEVQLCMLYLLIAKSMSMKLCNVLSMISVQDGYTALYSASQEGHEKIVQLLIQAGADVVLQNTVS